MTSPTDNSDSLPIEQIGSRDLKIILTVAGVGSFHKASRQLNMGQSAVSRRVQRLEDLLGVSLFERRSTGVRLTIAGSEFLACAAAVYENLKAGVSRARSASVASHGALRVGTMSSFSNGPQREIIKNYTKQHPEVSLSFIECERHQMITMLVHRKLDVVIVVGEPPSESGDSLVLTRAPGLPPLAQTHVLKWCEVSGEEFLVSAWHA